jgi:hypothetical protein
MDQCTLKTRALIKYKTMLEDNEWCAISPQEETVIAISEQLKDSNLNLTNVDCAKSFHKVPSIDKECGKKKSGKASNRASIRMTRHGRKHQQGLAALKRKHKL